MYKKLRTKNYVQKIMYKKVCTKTSVQKNNVQKNNAQKIVYTHVYIFVN